MKITFKTVMPIGETMKFEEVFEEELRLDVADKSELLKNCIKAFMFVDGAFAGEIYGAGHTDFDEEIPDIDHGDSDFIYLYSAALLPGYEGKGLAKILMAFWLGQVNGKYDVVTAHCTHPAMTHLCQTFGGVFFGTHQNWFDSGREATFCKIYLS